jgi:hypothetical protein
MSTPSPSDRPRRPFQHLSQRQGQQPDERRPLPRTSHRRDDLRHVNEELQQAQNELEQSDRAGDDAIELTGDDVTVEKAPPVASRALAPLAKPRLAKRFDPPAGGAKRVSLDETTSAAEEPGVRPEVSRRAEAPKTVSASSQPPTSGGPGGRNWDRRQLARYGIIAGVLVLTVWLAPIIAGYTPLRNLVLSSLGNELNGTVSASSASFGWFSPVQLHNVEVRDDRGELVLTIPTVKTSRMLRQILFDSSNVGSIQLDRPQARVVLDRNGSNVERVLSKLLASRDPSMTCPKLDVEVVDGSATVEDVEARGRWQIEGLGAKLELPRDWSGPMALQVAGKVVQPGRGGQFDARLEMTKSRQSDGFIDHTGLVKLSTTQFPLAMLQGLVARHEPGTQLAGWLNGEGVCRWDGESRDGRPLTVEGLWSAEGVDLRGPALGTDTLHLNQLHLRAIETSQQGRPQQAPCRIVWQGNQVRIDRWGADCDVGQVNLNGSLLIDLRYGLVKGLNQALRTNAYDFKGEVDLATLARIMPDTLSIRQGTQITDGRLTVELSRNLPKGERYAAATGATWKGQLVTTSLRAINDGRPVAWDKPIQVKFAAQETPRGMNVQQLECRSDFVTLTATGEPGQRTVLAEYHLDKLATRLSDFLDLSNVTLAGDGWSQLQWRRQDDGKIDVWCETQLDRFAVRLGKQQLLAEDKLALQLQAALQADPQTLRLQRVETGTLLVTSGGDRLQAKLAGPVELASLSAASANWAPTAFPSVNLTSASASSPGITSAGIVPAMPSLATPLSTGRDSFGRPADVARGTTPLAPAPGALSPGALSPVMNETAWPLEIELRGDLARWRSRMQPIVSLPADWQINGDAQVAAHVDLSRSQIHVHNSNAKIHRLRATVAGWAVDEQAVDMSISGLWQPQERRGEITQALIQGSSAAFQANQLSWSLPRRGEGWPTLAGEVTFNVDLGEVQRWSLAAPKGKIAPSHRLAGDAAGRLRFERSGQSAHGKLEVWADKLSVAATGTQAVWRDPRAHLQAELRYDQLSDVLLLSDLNVTTTTNTFSFSRGEGKIMQLRGARDLELRGYLSYSAQEVANILFPAAAKDIVIQPGPSKEHPFYIRGMLGDVRSGDPFARNPQQAARPLWARLTTGSQVDWTGANIYGFRFAAGEIRAEMRDGQVYFEPFNLSMNEGRLMAHPRIDLVSNPPRVILEAPPDAQGKPFTLVDHVRITPEMCNRGLKYALPPLYGVTEAQGQFSVRMKGCEIPLDDPFRGERAGELVVHNIDLAPGPMLLAVAQVIDAYRLATGKKPDATSQLRVARLKRESVVEYRMFEGKVYHRNLELEFDGLTIKTEGWVAVDQSIKLLAKVTAPGLTSRVPLAGAGATEISIPIAGTLDRPKLDTGALKGTLLQDVLRAPSNEMIRKGLEDGTRDVIRGIDTGLDRLINPRNR